MKRYSIFFFVMFLIVFMNENAFAFNLGDFLKGDVGSYKNCDSKGTIAQLKKLIPKVPAIRVQLFGVDLEIFEIKDIKTTKKEKNKKFCSALAKTSHGNYLIDYDVTTKDGKYRIQANLSENHENYIEEERISKQLNHLKTGTVSDIKRNGKMFKVYNIPGKSTDLQKKRMTNKITGKIVNWDLMVSNVNIQKDKIYVIQSFGEFMEEEGEIIEKMYVEAYIRTITNEQRDFIESLSIDSSIKIKGIIDRVGEEFFQFTSDIIEVSIITLNPAILFDERWNEKEKVPSAQNKVDCSAETDSLQRLTCYDNLPEDLKDEQCSSISDSLKRLSCFDNQKS